MTKAVIYSRVSTEEQDPENQILVLERWAKERGFEVVRIYRENESAWKAGHQHELAKLTRDAQSRRFSVVLVWALDRLSRGGALAILTLVHKLGGLGVRVVSHQEPWTEMPSEISDILYSLTGWVANMESKRISERTKAGLARRIAEGHKLGRPPGSKDSRRRKKRAARRPVWE